MSLEIGTPKVRTAPGAQRHVGSRLKVHMAVPMR
jgi:hypothetical protein